jgi:hypothetical protein
MHFISALTAYFCSTIFGQGVFVQLTAIIIINAVLIAYSYYMVTNWVTKPIQDSQNTLEKMALNDYTQSMKEN